MADEMTARGYPLPNPDNIAREDATRIRNAIQAIDNDLAVIEADMANSGLSATESRAGRVQLATQEEAAAGSATDVVPTVKRVRDMIVALLDVLEATVNTLSDRTTADKGVLQSAINARASETTAALAARALLAGGQSLTGGFSGNTPVIDVNAGTTFTPNPHLGNVQAIKVHGAHTMVPPAVSACTMVLQYFNHQSGGVTLSGFTKVTGSTMVPNINKGYFLFITKSAAWCHLHIVAVN